MVTRGLIYSTDNKIHSSKLAAHYYIVLSPTNLMTMHPEYPDNRLFVTVAMIRPAITEDGTKVRLIRGHSIPLRRSEHEFLNQDSIVETHQLFGVELSVIRSSKSVGKIKNGVLKDILSGAKLLFT
jgi:hypothetical protein